MGVDAGEAAGGRGVNVLEQGEGVGVVRVDTEEERGAEGELRRER